LLHTVNLFNVQLPYFFAGNMAQVHSQHLPDVLQEKRRGVPCTLPPDSKKIKRNNRLRRMVLKS
jgi:hypothetical protein